MKDLYLTDYKQIPCHNPTLQVARNCDYQKRLTCGLLTNYINYTIP